VPRRLHDFIEAFCTYSEVYNTTPLFSKAAAIWMVGTAARRQIGMRARGNALHPNLFIELVGGPGTGKSQAINSARSIFIPATGSSIIPASVTRAGMEDYMQQNLQQSKSPDGALLLSHECIGLSEEMQGILPDQDLGHLTLYNILYDLPKLHKARTRSHGEVTLESPYCSILTGAQPAFLATTMPEQAWGMGFMSRSMMVFDVPRERRSMFELRDINPKLKADLIVDLKSIAETYGWIEWTKEAEGLYNEWWVEAGGQPVPQAKRLAMGYNSRRELHMAKLAMVMSLSRTEDLFVTETDVAEAIRTLLGFESNMNSIFQEMASTGSMVMLQDVIDTIKANTAAGKPTEEATIINLLMQRFPSTQVHSMINNLIDSKVIKNVSNVDVRGCRKFEAGDSVALV
jgi:hypothetical protein